MESLLTGSSVIYEGWLDTVRISDACHLDFYTSMRFPDMKVLAHFTI